MQGKIIGALLTIVLLLGVMTGPYVAAAEGWEALHGQAMKLAVEEKYELALPLLAKLQAQFPTTARILFDRTVVLQWASRDVEAIQLFEAKIRSRPDVPAYVQEAVATAYYRQKSYATARGLYRLLSQSDDRRMAKRAILMEAETLLRQGNPAEAQRLYDEMLGQNSADIDVYLARAKARFEHGDKWRALSDFDMARTIAEKTGDDANTRQISALMASACIGAGDMDRAESILRPYIRRNQADPAMQASYVAALCGAGKPEQAIKAAEEFWPDLGLAPSAGVRVVGDAYLLSGKIDQAIRAYGIALQDDSGNIPAMLGMAAAKVQKGQLNEAVKLYEQVLAVNASWAEVILDDCLLLMQQGKSNEAKRIFTQVTLHIPIKSGFYQKYMERLKISNASAAVLSDYQKLRNAQ